MPWIRKVVSVFTQLYLSRRYWAPFFFFVGRHRNFLIPGKTNLGLGLSLPVDKAPSDRLSFLKKEVADIVCHCSSCLLCSCPCCFCMLNSDHLTLLSVIPSQFPDGVHCIWHMSLTHSQYFFFSLLSLSLSLSLSFSLSFVHTVIWIWTHGHSAAIGRDGIAERKFTRGK